jgi:amino acid transporter
MYAVPVLAVLIVLPAGAVTSLNGFLDALKTVLTVYGGQVSPGGAPVLAGAGQVLGWASAALFLWVLAASAAAWTMGSGRAQAAACLDGAGPRWLGRISPRTGVPVRIGLLSGVLALAVMAAGVAVTGQDNQKYFSAALTAVISLVVLAYLLVFPAFAVLRRREPSLDRPFRAGGGRPGAVLVTVAATGWSVLAAACLLWPGLGTANPDAHLPAGFAGQRALFELLVLGPIAAIAAAATAYCLATSLHVRDLLTIRRLSKQKYC